MIRRLVLITLFTSAAVVYAAGGDRDQDGYLNSVEVDDDGDAIFDCNNDGRKNGQDDDDGDGLLDSQDSYLFDKDNDGIRNDAETKLVSSQKDDDGDGVRDKFEKIANKLNHDNDDLADSVDSDDDNDGITDDAEVTADKRDHDNDDYKDKRDSDDDNDGILDLVEQNCAAVTTPTVISANWTDELYIDNGGGSVGHGLAVDSNNMLHAAWTVATGSRLYINYGNSTDGGATWTISEDITNSNGASFGGNIAVGPDNTVHIAYLVTTATGNALYYIQSADQGSSWSQPISLTDTASFDAATPSITVDDSGHIHIAWHNGDTDSATVYTKVFYTQSIKELVFLHRSNSIPTIPDTRLGHALLCWVMVT
ncbi:MAG: exo-alpha-sialidase [Candidatus Kerfeldbacteria bacterium]|nr:exo-alpha-sialidase [Candidatus Kerfeldbacteria bacterium]